MAKGHESTPLDARGVPIEVGATIVVAGASGRLREERVKAIERPGKPEWWVNVRFEGGNYTTPDRLAVIPHGE